MSQTVEDCVVGVLGCGRMGSAMVQALGRQGGWSSDRIVLLDRDVERARALASTHTPAWSVVSDIQELVCSVDLLVLAMKPQDAPKALQGVAWDASRVRTLVSVLAGTRTETLRSWVPDRVCVVRTMPNTPALIGAGVTAILRSGDDSQDALVQALFEPCGHTVFLEKESLFDAVTGLSGSGPAYVFVALEALADGGVKMGLPRAVARELAVHTLLGSAKLALESGEHTAELKDQVSSPGGTTIHGLSALEESGFRRALISAVEAATRRSNDLGKG